MEWKQYRKQGITEMRPYQPGEDMTGISVSIIDAGSGSPKQYDMIARDPNRPWDRWLVAEEYFLKHYEPVD